MARPGTQIISRDTPPPRSAPTDTGVWFVAGITERGAAGATLVQSMADFERKFGPRLANGYLYDALETFFREGGGKAYVSRVFGPTPVTSSLVLEDGDTDPALTVSAKSPGVWGDDISVAVVAGDSGGEYKLNVYYNDVLVETSGSVVDNDALVAWSANSTYITVEKESDVDPAVVAATNLADGDDDATSATDATWETALDFFTSDLGPGQVSMPGRATAQAYTDLVQHAEARSRVALLDAPNTATAATLKTSASGVRSLAGARYSAMFAPWVTVPGLTAGTTRLVPPSALVAGVIARNDGLGMSPNVPAAGENGQSNYALAPTFTYTETEREELNVAGVDVIRTVYGGVRIYGWRSGVDPNGNDSDWVQFSNARLRMAIASGGNAIIERYVFAEIDGRGIKQGQLRAELTAMLLDYYNKGSLYGSTPDEAFIVDTGASVNPPEQLADGELRALIAVRMSPFAELVVIELVKVAITEAVA